MRDHNTVANLVGQTIKVVISGDHTLRQGALRQGIAIKAGVYTMKPIKRSNRNVNLYQVQVGKFTFMAIIKKDDWSDNYRLVTFYYGSNEQQVIEHKQNDKVYQADMKAKQSNMSIQSLIALHKEIKQTLGH